MNARHLTVLLADLAFRAYAEVRAAESALDGLVDIGGGTEAGEAEEAGDEESLGGRHGGLRWKVLV